MPDFTRDQLEQRLSERIGDYFAGTTDANGAASGSTFISDDLLLRPGNSFVPWYSEITSGDRDGDVRVNQQFERDPDNSDEPTITAENPFGAQIVSGVTFRMHQILPLWKAEALAEALRALTNVVPLIATEDFVSGQLLRNGNFEHWRDASTLFDWVLDGGTLARQAATIYQGRYAAGLTGVSGQLSQRIDLAPELEGITITLTVWVYHTGATGSEVIARISVGGADNDNPVDPTQNTWTLLTATASITDPSLPIVAKLLNTGTDIVYFDLGDLRPPDDNRFYWVPRSAAFQNIHDIQIGPQQDSAKTTVGGFQNHPMPDLYNRGYGWYRDAGPYRSGVLATPYHMRMAGPGYYPLLAAGTDVVELGEEEADYLVIEAAIRALHKAKGADHLSANTHWAEIERDLNLERSELAPRVQRDPGVLRLR